MLKSKTNTDFIEIPLLQPSYPVVGNVLSFAGKNPVLNLMRLLEEQGPLFTLDIAGQKRALVSTQELVHELSDETRFEKDVHLPIQKVRELTADGLFTVETRDPVWKKAHNILMPAFSLKSMHNYVPYMFDIASQLILKWKCFDEEVDIADQMTRLTFDTIGLAGFGMRFNSFYREGSHPFIRSMINTLVESMIRSQQPDFVTSLKWRRKKQFQKDQQVQYDLVDAIIKYRQENTNGSDPKDLLSMMLSGVDKDTGEKLDNVNIRYQIITFLIAGHETTSGLLSFAIYFLLKNPEIMVKAQEEADRVLGNKLELPSMEQINKLTYITQILKESLRLWPTAPAFAVHPLEDTVIGGKYTVKKGLSIMVLLPSLHRDKKVWGEHPEHFDPDNFGTEREKQRAHDFPDAYKPFGNGMRSCIGRQFAMTEATLVLGLILAHFTLSDPYNYTLKIKESLTMKPEKFIVRYKKRTDSIIVFGTMGNNNGQGSPIPAKSQGIIEKHNTPMLVLFGSNLGTAEDMADKLGAEGEYRGFQVTIAPLDHYSKALPKEGAVIIVSSTYNGTPTDNALEFCRWIETPGLSPTTLEGVRFAVFGCGNTDWETFQFIPRMVDNKLEILGGKRLTPLGEGDANFDLYGSFDDWLDTLWQALAGEFSINLLPENQTKEDLYTITILNEVYKNPVAETFAAQPMKITENRELCMNRGTGDDERSIRHLEIALPRGVNYETGDYLGIIPHNNEDVIREVLDFFKLHPDTKIMVSQNRKGKPHLPINTPVSVKQLLLSHVELRETITRHQLKLLSNYTGSPATKEYLHLLYGDDNAAQDRYKQEILIKHITIINLLKKYPDVALPFHLFLELLPPLKPRYYSISSSAQKHPDTCSITVGVLKEKSLSGEGLYVGTCSAFLQQSEVNSTLSAFCQPNKTSFRLPEDSTLPLLFIAAGTGLAPFRGFLQERMYLKTRGIELGKALLFYGCRHPEKDYIYKQELEEWENRGIVTLRTAFSRVKDKKKMYVQDTIKKDQELVWEMISAGALIYLCGSAARIAPGVKQVLMEIYSDHTGKDMKAGESWIEELIQSKRLRNDIWTSN